MNDEIVRKLKAALNEATPKTKRTSARNKPSNVISITINASSSDGAGVGNTVIKTEKVINKTIAQTNPGQDHINESQVRILHNLKDEIIRLESIAKKKPVTHQSVWLRLNKHVGVGAMRMIPLKDFAKAEKFLRTWIGRLNSAKSVQNEEPDLIRLKRIRYIHANMKALDIEGEVREYIFNKFAIKSIGDLNKDQLDATYRFVAGRKSVKK